MLVRSVLVGDAGVSEPDGTVWLGWAAWVAFLQLWHLLMPIDWRVLAVLVAVGLIGLASSFPQLRLFAAILRGKRWWEWAVVGVLGLWIANLAIAPPVLGDSGLYHFASVRWAAEHAIVPGLGNLHGRLAFNSSYFLWVALLGAGPSVAGGFHLANGILILVPLTRSALAAGRIVTGRQHRARHLFEALLLFPLAQMAWDVHYLSSPSPDLVVFVVGVVASSFLVDLVDTSEGFEVRRSTAAAVVVVVVCAGVVTKLSLAVFAAAALAVAAAVLLMTPGATRPRPMVAGAAAALLLAPWSIRGVILSGYPFYPYPGLSLPLRWAVPRWAVEEEFHWVMSWARLPGAHWSDVIGSTAWFEPWLRGLTSNAHLLVTVVAPFLVTILVGAAAVLVLAVRGKAAGQAWPLLLAPLPAALSLIYWFFTAPAPRLAGSTFFVVPAGLAVAVLVGLGRSWAVRGAVIVSVMLALLGLGHELLQRRLVVSAGSDHGFHPPPTVALRWVVTDGGLTLLQPVDGEDCWNAPLPCSPCPLPGLRLRRAGDLGAGFVIVVAEADDGG